MYKKKKYENDTIESEEEEESNWEEGVAKPISDKTIKAQLPKWIIDADLTMAQYDGAIKLLKSGMKLRKVAALFGIHRSKIRLA